MDTLRRRIPFKLGHEDDGSPENEVLDEQQQDEVIDRLRKENEVANHRYSMAMKLVVGLSCILHITALTYNPLLTIYPSPSEAPSIPLPIAFVLLALYIHLHLVVLFFSSDIQAWLQLAEPPRPHSFRVLYLLSAMAPTTSLFLAKPWQTTLWWCSSALVIFIADTVVDAIEQNNQGIKDLEKLKYTAPGA
ncbi:hypothetical protein CVT26_000010 [Gymnopilus dilepis]|uniref:GPI ethanolamine phosphate transferase 1 n=1 Tax=Gymnopilus dilepis TaxID=231916 RepID=A0A409VGM9_9AGAR|nr:hypothetical protein CVT26_000010 [Gymnopilus dilepis]